MGSSSRPQHYLKADVLLPIVKCLAEDAYARKG